MGTWGRQRTTAAISAQLNREINLMILFTTVWALLPFEISNIALPKVYGFSPLLSPGPLPKMQRHSALWVCCGVSWPGFCLTNFIRIDWQKLGLQVYGEYRESSTTVMLRGVNRLKVTRKIMTFSTQGYAASWHFGVTYSILSKATTLTLVFSSQQGYYLPDVK